MVGTLAREGYVGVAARQPLSPLCAFLVAATPLPCCLIGLDTNKSSLRLTHQVEDPQATSSLGSSFLFPLHLRAFLSCLSSMVLGLHVLGQMALLSCSISEAALFIRRVYLRINAPNQAGGQGMNFHGGVIVITRRSFSGFCLTLRTSDESIQFLGGLHG